MGDVDFCNPNNELEKDLRHRLVNHNTASSFGFNHIQTHIERVNDLLNFSSILIENHHIETNDGDGFYNLALGNVIEEMDGNPLNETMEERTWICPNKYISENPFSELSESTQKVIGRLHLKEEASVNNEIDDQSDDIDNDDDEIQMEEDELEFTFSNRPNSLLTAFVAKGVLSAIDEQDEEDSSSDEDSDSARSTVIERIELTHFSVEVIENENVTTQGDPADELKDDTEECFSDSIKYSLSSSKAFIEGQGDEEITFEDTTIKAVEDLEQIFQKCSSLEDKSSSSTKGDEDFASEAEYDNSVWSTEDIPQSVEQSDSLYEKAYHSMVKSSMPDLLKTSDERDMEILGGSLMARHYNKATDLDEMLGQLSPYPSTPDHRLSQSLCNLCSTTPGKVVRLDNFFQERDSTDNLLETDLDSGYISIYKPVRETEILPKVDFSSSMGNICQPEGSFSGYSSTLVDRLRKKAGSVSELRIADSLSKLNIPSWLNLPDCESGDLRYDYSRSSTPVAPLRSPTSLDRTLHASQARMRSLPRDMAGCVGHPLGEQKPPSVVVLPSQALRQSSQKRLTPIYVCQARQLLLPNRVTVSSLKRSSAA